MTEVSLEEVISEEAFAPLLESQSEMFFRLTNSLLSKDPTAWSRGHYFQLIAESDTLESFLDDYGASNNQTYSTFREMVAGVRSFAYAGFSISHLVSRIATYGATLSLSEQEAADARASISGSGDFIQTVTRRLLDAAAEEARVLGVAVPKGSFPANRYLPHAPRQTLSRNIGQEEIEDEEQRIAEVAAKFLQVCGLFDEMRVHRIDDEHEREMWFAKGCSEEQARVFEATVHNLQSTYDTHVKNTVLEAEDGRLPAIRGHVSAALHMLEAVTHLTHFVDRHESGARHSSVEERMAELVSKSGVREITLNSLLVWATRFIQGGRSTAEELLPAYTNMQVLEVEIGDDLTLHARPAALIANVVNRYGTPVEMEVNGATCNAGSILELMIAVGSNPDCRRFIFRGDENPLRDIGILFENNLAEDGLDVLPNELSYLRPG